MQFTFPKGFFWGASTSSHQVEGGNVNSWSVWESQNAWRLAAEAETKFGHLASWPHIKEQALNPDNYISGIAADHYHRYEEDFDIAQSLGHNAHRFSIEWSRIEPEEGKWNQEAIEHYRKVLQALRARGIEPFVTLWHWPLPLWLETRGGWKSRHAIKAFKKYTAKIVEELGNEITFWIPLNEPTIFASLSYLKGEWPPQEKSIWNTLRVMVRLLRAHKGAYKIIKAHNTNAQVGIAHAVGPVHTRSRFSLLKVLVPFLNWISNYISINRIQSHLDFIGINYYHRRILSISSKRDTSLPRSDMGWELYPQGMYEVLTMFKKYGKPMIITENGLADAKDTHRAWLIKETLHQVVRAMHEGAKVKGYLYWSLLDNFEWDKGFWPRFGLVEVDYTTLTRTIRPSALEYAKICKTNTLDIKD